MGETAQVKVQLDSEAKLAALDEYTRRTGEAAKKTKELRASMGTGEAAKLGVIFGAVGLTIGALSERFAEGKAASAALASEIARASGTVGTSAEAYQVLGNILKGAGGDTAELTASLAHLRNALGEAIRNPDSGPVKTLQELKLSAKGLSQLKPEAALEKIAKALATIEDPARRASLAQDLLGRGASNIAPLIDRLATDGYGTLRDEVAKTAGVMSGEMAKALDDAANRAENAGNRMAVALAPFQLRAAETKATVSELFAELAESKFSLSAGAAAVGGIAAVGAGGAAAAGALGPAEAWGLVAGVAVAKAAATQAPVWASIGLLIATAFAGAGVIKGLEKKNLAQQDLREEENKSPLDRAAALRGQLTQALTPQAVSRIQTEAARRARKTYDEARTEDDPEMRANLQEASRMYSGIVAQTREHSAAIIAANKELDAQKKLEKQLDDVIASQVKREKEAADWLTKNADTVELANEAQRRKAELDKLDPTERLARLEQERTAALETNQHFAGTASENRRMELVTTQKVLALDEQILATKKEALEVALRGAKANGIDYDSLKNPSPGDLAAGVNVASEMQLSELQKKGAADQANFKLTAEQKRALRRQNLGDQGKVLDDSADMLRTGDTKDIQRSQQFSDKSAAIGADLAADQAGTPQTALEGVEAGLTKIQDRWGTLSQQIETGVASIGDAITGSLAGGMQQLLGTTEQWTQKLGGIAGPIMGAVTQAISKMFAEWIVGRAAAAAKSILFSTQEGAADTAAKAPGAMFASISSWGTAAAIGVAAFLGAKALAGGFFEGGFTGLGNPHDPAGIVHKGEFVIPHDVTSAVGPGALGNLVDSVRNPNRSFAVPEALAPQSHFASGNGGGQGGAQADDAVAMPRVLLIDHRDQDLIDRVLSDPRFSTKVRRVGRNNTGDFGSEA